MSPEQNVMSSTMRNNNQISDRANLGSHEFKSDLEQIEVIRAREQIASLLNNPISTVATEALQTHIETSRRSPQEQVRIIGGRVVSMRTDYDAAHINIREEEVAINPDAFDLTEEKYELTPDMFNASPLPRGAKREDYDLTA